MLNGVYRRPGSSAGALWHHTDFTSKPLSYSYEGCSHRTNPPLPTPSGSTMLISSWWHLSPPSLSPLCTEDVDVDDSCFFFPHVSWLVSLRDLLVVGERVCQDEFCIQMCEDEHFYLTIVRLQVYFCVLFFVLYTCKAARKESNVITVISLQFTQLYTLVGTEAWFNVLSVMLNYWKSWSNLRDKHDLLTY